MKLHIPKRTAIRAAVLLAASGLVTVLAMQNEPEPARKSTATAPPVRQATAGTAPRQIPLVDLSGLARETTTEIKDDLFYVPPPPPPPAPAPVVVAPPPPPPAPTAPPLPFKYLGRLVDRGSTVVFVSHNDQNLALKQGDTVAGAYRVEQLSATEVVFLYVPLSERQVMHLEPVN